MADGLAWQAASRPRYLCCGCHLKLLVAVFSSAVHGLEERALVVTQECRVFLAERFGFGHVHCVLSITGMAEAGWALRTWDWLTQLRNS